MPFGKANSSKLFCRWASLWFKSCITRFNQIHQTGAALGSYVDDAFGGATTRQTAAKLIHFITKAGDAMATVVNTSKTEGPATAMVILGLHYCSQTKICKLDPAKVTKYSDRLRSMLRAGHCTSKDLERLIGNLEFAAWVEPFGRPLLSFISREITPDRPRRRISLPYFTRVAMRIWLRLLQYNRGLRYAYILNALPAERRRIFVDAASTGGIGGYASYTYFSVSLHLLIPHLRRCDGWSAFPRVDIAWLELFAAFVAIDLFAADSPGHLLVLYSDNTNVVAWLTRRRSPNPFVGTLVSAIERLKYKFIYLFDTSRLPTTSLPTSSPATPSRNVLSDM